MSEQVVGRPMEILLVEDTLEDARATIDALKQGEVICRVTLVVDGEEAMAFLRREGVFARAPRPDLLLLDIELPKKTGREVLADIRKDAKLKDLPVVVLTASAVHKAVFSAQGLRVDSYMTKPVSRERFLDVVKELKHDWLKESVVLPTE
ncbi:MAG: response regulator [Rhodopirellula sp.]|nr:response regulator [Rhodopirellula sp.]